MARHDTMSVMINDTRRSRPDQMPTRTTGGAARPAWRDDRRLAGRVPRRLGARGARRRSSAGGPSTVAPGPRRLAGRRARSRSAACGRRRARLSPAELRATEPAVRRGDGHGSCPASSAAPRRGAARRRRTNGRRRPGRLGPRQRRRPFASADRPARDGAARPGHARTAAGSAKATMALANRWVTTRQLGFLLGFMGLEGPRPVRPRACSPPRRTPGKPALRRGEHPRRPRRSWTCRSSRSGPGSPSTRRPTRSSSRPTLAPARTSPIGSSASSACSAGRRAGSGREALRSLGRVAPAARTTAPSTGWSG